MVRKTLGKYTIIQVIAQGGMGKILLAESPDQKKPVVIKKLIITGREDVKKRFERESKLMMNFKHPNIIKVKEFFQNRSNFYMVMEYIDGSSLDKIIKEKQKLPIQISVTILFQICLGLQYAHSKGVVHRDIKPANVLIGKNGKVKLTDFGIATSDANNDENLTKTGIAIGTPAYMSPEQIKSAKHVDNRSDIYSLGIMFYEMITGKKPYASDFSGSTIEKINKGKYITPEKLNPDIPGYLRAMIKKSMHHKINSRFKSIDLLSKTLTPVIKKIKDQKQMDILIKKFIINKSISK